LVGPAPRIAVAFNLLLFLVGDFIAGRRGWLRALGGLVVLIFAALMVSA